jgi:hypothetical protein
VRDGFSTRGIHGGFTKLHNRAGDAILEAEDRAPAPKGVDLVTLAASLKRCPDTNPWAGAEARKNWLAVRGAEAPLFHGAARVSGAACDDGAAYVNGEPQIETPGAEARLSETVLAAPRRCAIQNLRRTESLLFFTRPSSNRTSAGHRIATTAFGLGRFADDARDECRA